MDALIPILQNGTRPAVSARELYRFLELRAGDFARWTEGSIVNNPCALPGVDWEVFLHQKENPAGGLVGDDGERRHPSMR